MRVAARTRKSVAPATRVPRRTAFTFSSAVNGFDGAVGQTPLVRIKSLSQETGCEILAKAEWMNPGGSVKDRAALAIIRNYEEKGLLKKGGTVVEGTAGNTGIGLAHICRARGYKCIIYMPDTQSREKIDLLKWLGAEVHAVPAVAFTDHMNYNHQAKRAADAIDGAVWANQFDNIANRYGHFNTTGPEIWEQTNGKVNAFVMSTGTGGTLAGTSMFLKAKKKDVKIILADPPGSVLYSHVKTGKLERTGTSSITEGIGQGRITENLKGAAIDDALFIDDSKTIRMVFKLLHDDGIFVGASSALNVVAAYEVAQQLGKGAMVTTVLCDGAARYASRLFNRKWLDEKGLSQHLEPAWLKALN